MPDYAMPRQRVRSADCCCDAMTLRYADAYYMRG